MKRKGRSKSHLKLFSVKQLVSSPYFLILFLLILLIGLYLFLTAEQPTDAAAGFYLETVTPQEEIKRGGDLTFDVVTLDQLKGSAIYTGISYDARKLHLKSVQNGEVGSVRWEPISDDGQDSRLVVYVDKVTSSADHSTVARIHFTIIDETTETNADGRGFTEVCSTFVPDTDELTLPTGSPQKGSAEPSPAKKNEVQPTQSTENNNGAPSIDSDNLDMSKLCIPFEINGSPADKMDFIMVPVNYEQGQFSLFAKDAKVSLQRVRESNLVEYKSEVINKMNWYLLNTKHENIPSQYRNNKITEGELDGFIKAIQGLCPHDRYSIFVNASTLGGGVGGSALLYEGFIFAARSLDNPRSNIFIHEWGHAAAGLIDEYDAGKWIVAGDGTAGFNCTDTPKNINRDPCPHGRCSGEDGAQYQQACPQWDCSVRECDPLMRELFADAGCYQRCSSQRGYRAAPVSAMDAVVAGYPDELLMFNGPSLYSIIQYTFGKYK